MMDNDLEHYVTPAAMTALPEASPLLDGLPTDARGLCLVSRELIVHEMMAAAYGVHDVKVRDAELEIRTSADMVAAIDRLDPDHQSLAAGRQPKLRLIGQCRQYATLTCALLRRAGIPARARAGFARYFDDTWTDHWLVDRWDADQGRWVRSDPQLDEKFRRQIKFEFDQLDLPDGEFLTAAEAWQLCRSGDEDPARFGAEHLRGLWHVHNNVIRDLASLNKVELLPWDLWGAMVQIGDVDAESAALVDEVAAAVVSDELDAVLELGRRDGLRVPETVVDARFEREVGIPR